MSNEKQLIKSFYDVLFDDGEHVSVSPDKFPCYSVSKEYVLDNESLVLKTQRNDPTKEKDIRVKREDIVLCAINPLKGARSDDNVTSFRSFLVEIDDMDFKQQLEYVKSIKLPYSLAVFSGNKSIHFAVVLKESLPSLKMYQDVAEWILKIVEKADGSTKNPSRGIRVAEGNRKDGKGLKQKLLEVKDRIDTEDLFAWLEQYPHLNPRLNKPKIEAQYNIGEIPSWVFKKLESGNIGIEKGRNNEWYSIAMSVAKTGKSYEEVESYLEQFFFEERDFKRREWVGIIKSAFKAVERGK